MKKSILLLSTAFLMMAAFGQTKPLSKEAKNLEAKVQNWANKKGYRLLIKFDPANNASFYAEPKQDYAVFYIYDIDPNKDAAFKAYLMTPKDSLRNKYTAHPSEIASSGTGGVQALQFTTKDLGGAAKLPVKIEAAPKAKMYVYRKKTTKAS